MAIANTPAEAPADSVMASSASATGAQRLSAAATMIATECKASLFIHTWYRTIGKADPTMVSKITSRNERFNEESATKRLGQGNEIVLAIPGRSYIFDQSDGRSVAAIWPEVRTWRCVVRHGRETVASAGNSTRLEDDASMAATEPKNPQEIAGQIFNESHVLFSPLDWCSLCLI